MDKLAYKKKGKFDVKYIIPENEKVHFSDLKQLN